MTPLPESLTPVDETSVLGRWELERIDRSKVANAIMLNFMANGQVRGAIECNSFLTDYRVADQAIDLGNAIITTAGCHPRFDAEPQLVEQAEATLFAQPPATISDDGEYLLLNGTSVLVFRRVR